MRVRLSSLIFAAALLQACALQRSTEGPMKSVTDALECRSASNTLIVFLPGAYDTPQDLVDQGFVSALRAKKIDADIQLVDAHTGYYASQQILVRLENEVIKPARAKGYARIWFVGISLGGYGTMLYAMKNPAAIDGFFVMAPYMGSRDVPERIQKQGGLKKWAAGQQDNTESKSLDVELWRWLKGYGNGSAGLPNAYLGYGASDRFALPNGVFAEVLPENNRFVIPGGHDWATWLALWDKFLTASPLPHLAADAVPCRRG